MPHWCPNTTAPDRTQWEAASTIDHLWRDADALCSRFRERGLRIIDMDGHTLHFEDTEDPVLCDNHNIPTDHLEWDEAYRTIRDICTDEGWIECQHCRDEGNEDSDCHLAPNRAALNEHLDEYHGLNDEIDWEDDWDLDNEPPIPTNVTTQVRDTRTGEFRTIRFNTNTLQWETVRPPASTIHGAFENG